MNANQFLDALKAAETCLERHRDLINALNVFPVPDGDTGTNMLLTFRSGLERAATEAANNLGQAADQFADGLFWGARGNSGVILSQFFKGFCQALSGLETAAGPHLADAFQQASTAAYQAVGQPVEGTMLSVAGAVASSLQSLEPTAATTGLWERAFRSSQEALSLTPTQLPVLAQAGVVDAGGFGSRGDFRGNVGGLHRPNPSALSTKKSKNPRAASPPRFSPFPPWMPVSSTPATTKPGATAPSSWWKGPDWPWIE